MAAGNKYRPKSVRAKVWEAIRSLKRDITVVRIALLTGAEEDNVKRYMRVLEMAGYLKRTGKDGHRLVYRLVKNTGPKAPVQKLIRCLWDPNTDEVWTER
jgi:hypothetical protein